MITLIVMLLSMKGEPIMWLRWHQEFTRQDECVEYSKSEKFHREVSEVVHRFGTPEEHEYKFMVICKAKDKA